MAILNNQMVYRSVRQIAVCGSLSKKTWYSYNLNEFCFPMACKKNPCNKTWSLLIGCFPWQYLVEFFLVIHLKSGYFWGHLGIWGHSSPFSQKMDRSAPRPGPEPPDLGHNDLIVVHIAWIRDEIPSYGRMMLIRFTVKTSEKSGTWIWSNCEIVSNGSG